MGRTGIDVERVGLAQDRRGFMRRACPACARHFKVSARGGEDAGVQTVYLGALAHANVEELDGPPRRFCPYCGHAASADRFLTAAQRQYVEALAKATAGVMRYEQLKQVERGLDKNPYLTFVAIAPREGSPEQPPEPDDMQPTQLLCCGEELKLKTSWLQPFFCPHCRARHGVS